MSKKRNKQPDANPAVSETSTEPCEEARAAGAECPHIAKAINLNKLKKNIKKTVILSECSTCKKLEADLKNTEEICDILKPLWICLQCGEPSCGKEQRQHAIEHHRKPRSDCHCMVTDSSHWSVWCYECKIKVHPNSRKKLLETVEFIKKCMIKEQMATISNTVDKHSAALTDLPNEVDHTKKIHASAKQTAELIVWGIPAEITMSHRDIMLRICQKLGVAILDTDIILTRLFQDYVKPRVTSSHDLSKDHSQNFYSFSVRIKSIELWNSVLEAKRKFGELSTRAIFPESPGGVICIDDLLPSHVYALLKKTKQRARECNYTHVWVRSGNIFVRKDEKSETIAIVTNEDLSKLVKEEMATLTNTVDKHAAALTDLPNEVDHTKEIHASAKQTAELTLRGIPAEIMMSHRDIMLRICQKLGVAMLDTDIILTRSLKVKSRVTSSHDLSMNRSPNFYSFSVRIKSIELSNSVLEAERKFGKLSTTDIFPESIIYPPSIIYVNEHLPSHVYELLKKTKQRARERNYARVWVRSGNIFVRKDKKSETIAIVTNEDLSKL